MHRIITGGPWSEIDIPAAHVHIHAPIEIGAATIHRHIEAANVRIHWRTRVESFTRVIVRWLGFDGFRQFRVVGRLVEVRKVNAREYLG